MFGSLQMHQPLQFELLFILLFLLLPFSSSDNPRYGDCEPFKCGGIDISYPFRVSSQSDSCGHPGFELLCENDKPLLEILPDNYSVLSIDYENNIISTVNTDFGGNNPCPRPDHNFTLESLPFNFTPQDGYLSFYNCSTLGQNLDFYLLSCVPNDAGFTFITAVDGIQNFPFLETCKAPLVVPVLREFLLDLTNLTYMEAVQKGFNLSFAADGCAECKSSGGRCRYDSSTSAFLCLCSDRNHPATCQQSGDGHAKSLKKKILIGGSSTGVGVLATLILLFVVLRRKSQSTKNGRNVENFLKNYNTQMPKRYSYSDIMKTTNFLRNKLGQGGYGSVFKGQLRDGRQVAVKILSESKGGGEDFINEVATIGRTDHVNVVSLVGFCSEGSKRALIYDYMPNGSLEKFIFAENPKLGALGWETTFQIALGIAHGLEYLHRGCNNRIVHFDIKPHNILLDQDFCPKISDFGLAKLFPNKQSVMSMTGARGTVGYIAPEVIYRSFGGVSHKSDVYSYGMLLLEMVGGRKNVDARVENISEIYFPDWIYNQIERRADLKLAELKTQTEDEIARKMIIVGLWCIQIKPADRPSVNKVVEMLEGNLNGLQIPPKPYLSSPTRSELAASKNSLSSHLLTTPRL